MNELEVVRREGGQLRVSPWRGGPTMAQITPSTAQVLPVELVEACVGSLSDSGYEGAFTSALSPAEQQPFLRAGFEVHEHLALLRHELSRVPPVDRIEGKVRLRRARRSHHRDVLAVDAAAFNPFWQFDAQSLTDARTATPSARFRVAVGRSLLGYAVTGRAGRMGYLQRLAVEPAAQGRGVGTALVVDSLEWARRHGVDTVLVNTQESNHRALGFYEHLGFQRESEGLAVLRRSLPVEGLP